MNANAPGVVWETAAEPWRVLHAGNAGVVDGNRATFGGSQGWVHQFDLETGKPIRARKLDMGTVTSLVDLGDGRILVVGFAADGLFAPPAAFVLDAAFEPKKVVLVVRAFGKTLAIPKAAAVPNGGVVITGAGLPLSIYDSKDLSVRSTLDNASNWSNLAVRGDILLAERSSNLKRFDLTTNGQRALGWSLTSGFVVGEGADVVRVTDNNKKILRIFLENKTTVDLPEEVSSLHAYDGKRFITTAKHELRVHDLPSGEIKKRITLPDAHGSIVAISGKRAVMASRGVVRMVDLETGDITPKVIGRHVDWLAVGNDGVVLSGADPEVWTMSNGKITATETLAQDVGAEGYRGDDARHFVAVKRDERTATLDVHTFGEKAIRTVTSETPIDDVYLGRDGTLLLTVDHDDHKRVLRAKGTKLEPLFEFNYDASTLAVDPDGDILLTLDGRVAVVGQDGKSIATLRVPHCETIWQTGALESTGNRAATFDQKDLALWDRKTGELLASIKVGRAETASFVPKRAELVLRFDDRVVLWSPTKGTRTLPWPGTTDLAISADGKKLALSFYDGRVGVYDLDVLLAAPLQPDFAAGDALPETCGENDPLALPKPDDDLDHVEDFDGGSAPDDDD